MNNIALALGQIEEAMGMVEAGNRSAALLALAIARALLEAAIVSESARVPLADFTPITAEEVERNS
jgi:hypothetical protein